MDLFRRFIYGGKSGGTKPSVWLVWANNSNQDDRVCTSTQCTYSIYCGRSDADNDIKKVEIFISTDLGASWNSIISNLTGNTFGDQISSGARWYKAVATDYDGNIGVSNILKIVHQKPAFGDIVLVYKGVEYQDWDMTLPGLPTPINMLDTNNLIAFQFKNIHTSEFVKLVGVGMSLTPPQTNAMSVSKYGNNNISPNILVSPQHDEILLSGSSTDGSFNRDTHTGLYVINLTQVMGSSGGVEIPGTINWLVNI